MTGHFIYQTYPFPFAIAMIKSGYYAGGVYYYREADQFVSKDTLGIHTLLLCDQEPNPFPKHNCMSCAKTCHNLTCIGHCCDYEPMLGLRAVVNV
jgi:hypothetical protein